MTYSMTDMNHFEVNSAFQFCIATTLPLVDDYSLENMVKRVHSKVPFRRKLIPAVAIIKVPGVDSLSFRIHGKSAICLTPMDFSNNLGT